MTMSPRERAFFEALRSMDDPYVSRGLRYAILQGDIPEGYFTRIEHYSFMGDFWESLSYAEPGSALEMRLLEKLTLPNMGTNSVGLSVGGPTCWASFWTRLLIASRKNSGIYTLAKQRLQAVEVCTNAFLCAAIKLTEKTDEGTLATLLRSKAILAANSWGDWRAVTNMKTGMDDEVRARALEALRTLPVERNQLEPALNSQDPEIQLIVIDRLLETFPDRCDLWRRRYLLATTTAERYRCWMRLLSLTPSASELSHVLYNVWEDPARRAQCLEAMEHLGADCSAWISVRSVGTSLGDPKMAAIQEVTWQHVQATAITCQNWCHVTRVARRKENSTLATSAFTKALELAKTFQELSSVYSLCLSEVQKSWGLERTHNPEHAQAIETLLAQMLEIGTFNDYMNGSHLLLSDRLHNVVRLAVTVPQMTNVRSRYFDAPYRIKKDPELYEELMRRTLATGQTLVASFLPKQEDEVRPRT